MKKTVSIYSNSSWGVIGTNLFYYYGWNLLRETIIESSPGITTNSWVWGLDLAGSPEKVGGIGGLLSWTRSSNTNTFLFYADGN